MIRVVPFKVSHLQAIEPQECQRVDSIPSALRPTLAEGWSFTVLDEQRRVLMCAGALPDEADVWWGWALLSCLARPRLLALTRAVKAIMPQTPCEAIRVGIDWTFEPGHKWAAMLGFRSQPELHCIHGVWCVIYEREVSHGS